MCQKPSKHMACRATPFLDIYMQVVQIVQIYYATLSYTKPHEVKPRHIMSRVMTVDDSSATKKPAFCGQ